MHQELELLTLKQRRYLHRAVDCHNNIFNEEAGLNNMYKTVDDRNRVTRNTGTRYMKVPNIRSCSGRKAYSYQGPIIWNSLDNETRQITDKGAYKRHISKQLCRDVNHPGWVCDLQSHILYMMYSLPQIHSFTLLN